MTDQPSAVAGAALVGAMWSYATTVLQPARELLRRVPQLAPRPVGDPPVDVPFPGLGPHFSRMASAPVLSDAATGHDHLVAEFDRLAEVYEAYVQPFSRPIFDAALAALQAYVGPDARVLDAGCGPGRQLQRVARLVPDGEVVGVDLASGMVVAAHRAARAHGLDHVACHQADVGSLPDSFDAGFDVVYSCLAHHHFPEPLAAAREALRCLRPGGVYAVIDPGPDWYVRLSAPLARWADPGWVGFHTPEAFRALLADAGFARAAWQDLLPGFGVALGQKAVA